MPVSIRLTDPLTVHVETANTSWFTSGIPARLVRRAAARPDPARQIVELCRSHRAGSATVVVTEGGAPIRLVSAKGIVGMHERFHVQDNNGWHVTDHFRNAAAEVPAADRHPDEFATAEHYLFRSVHGNRTYSPAVDRVTHGEVVSVDLETGEKTRRVVDRLEPPETRLTGDAALDALDAALAASMDLREFAGKEAVLFSGGVDSTLLLTYVKGRAAAVVWIPDTPEFAHETARARTAARMLSIETDDAPVREADYVSLLAKTTELLGWPCMHYGTPMFSAAYDKPYDRFFMGEGADALFGVGMRLARVSSWLANPVAVAVLRRAKDRGPAHIRYRLGQIFDAASRLRMPVGPHSYALGSAGSPAAETLVDSLDTDVVTAALQSKLDYVDERVALETGPSQRVQHNFEYRHWAFTLADPILVERHQAQARGKALINPFGSPLVVGTALAVPVRQRYVKGLRGKWLVKELLRKRLPGYPIDQRKGNTALPLERFYHDGPLDRIWDRYDVPAVFTGKARDAVVAGNCLTWQAIAFAVWDTHVARNPALKPHPATVTADLG